MFGSIRHYFARLLSLSARWIKQLPKTDQAFMILIPIAIGLLGGLGASALRFLIHFFEGILWGSWGASLGWMRTLAVP